MSSSIPFQEIKDSLRQILTTALEMQPHLYLTDKAKIVFISLLTG